MTFRKAKQAPRPEPVLVDDGDGGFPVETSGPEATMLVIVSRGVVEVPHPTLRKFLRKEEDGTLTYTPRKLHYFPGSEVELEVSRARELVEQGFCTLPGELPKVGRHPDMVFPVDSEAPGGPVYEPGPVVSQIDAKGRIIK
jgi:hypothetical protein